MKLIEKIEKQIKQGKKEYIITCTNDAIEVYVIEAYMYENKLNRYANGKKYTKGIGTKYSIYFLPNKRYAKTNIWMQNFNWVSRGHGINDGWIEAEGHILQSIAKQKVKNWIKELQELEDDELELIELFNEIKEIICESCKSYD